jgi:type I restriction enzyme S subunit
MKNQRNKARNVPNLRFPDFDNEWEEKRLGEISSNLSYGMNAAAVEFDGKNKYIRITDIDEENRTFISSSVTSPNGVIEDKFRLKQDDIVFARTGASVGKSYLYNTNDGKLYFAGFLIKASINEANSKFVFYNTLRQEYNKWVKVMSMRSGQPGINAEEYKSFKVHLPIVSEQQKIACFLTVIDSRINTQIKIIKEYQLLKQGLMQKIFSQEIRFKYENGNPFPDWGKKRIGDLYSFKQTNSYSRDKLNYITGDVKNIHYGDIHTNFSSHFDIEKEYVPYINSNIDLSRISGDCFVQQGDLVIADASEDYADIGKTIEIIQLNNEKLVAGLHTFLARRNNKNIVVGFGGHLFKSFYLRLAIMRIAQGTKVLSLSTKRLAEIKVQVPNNEEQQRIANFLSALDQKIEVENQLSDQLKNQKQFLLQNLFI